MTNGAGIAIAAGIGTGAGLLAWWLMRRMRIPPAERERRRRLSVNAAGRMVDGHITDVHENFVYYSYSVRGVVYTTSQDISAIRDRLPREATSLIGGVTGKYSPGNPADSIVVCEHWSGFRLPGAARSGRRPEPAGSPEA
jgi:hypothetical protein